MAISFCHERDPRAILLRERLAHFYATVEAYEAFHGENFKPEYWSAAVTAIRRILARRKPCRVLEFGAGLTGFARYLGPLRAEVELHLQDVTARNEAHLRGCADRVHIGDLLEVRGEYDVIFSTFVWEHLTQPRACLEHLLSLLAPDGELLIACPRYDFPFYISPSAKRDSRPRRVLAAVYVAWRRLRTLVTRSPAFLLHTEPAAVRGFVYRDCDAVHWASLWDLECAVPPDWIIERLRIPASGLLGRFWEKHLLLFVRIRRARDSAPAR